MKNKSMTTEEHIEVAEHLRQAETHLKLAIQKLSEHYPKTGKVMSAAYSVFPPNNRCRGRALNNLRLLLECEEGKSPIGDIYFKH